MAAVCVGAFMGQLDASIVTVALPTLQHTFDVSVGAVTWVGLSYLLVLVATVIAVGRFADMWGRKLLYVYGFVIFTLASVLCGLAPDLGGAVRLPGAAGGRRGDAAGEQPGHHRAGRARAGRSGGPSACRARPRRSASPWARRSAGCCWRPAGGASSSSSTSPSGCSAPSPPSCWCPAAGTSWRGCASTGPGSAIFFPAVVALALGHLLRGRAGLELEPRSSGSSCAAAVLGVLFVWHERRDSDPMLDLGLFRNARFSTGIASGIGSYLVMFGVLLLIPFYLERGLGLGTARSGLELMAMPLAFGIVAPLAGRLADHARGPAAHRERDGAGRPGPGPPGRASGRRPPGSSLLLAVIGVGMGLFTSPNNASIMGAAPGQQAGMASGVLNMTRGMGTALGLAVTGTIFVVAGGDSGGTSGAQHAFTVTAYVLAAIAAAAGVVSALRANGALANATLSSVE